MLLVSAAIDVVRRVTVPLRIMYPLKESKTVYQVQFWALVKFAWRFRDWGHMELVKTMSEKLLHVVGSWNIKPLAHLIDLYKRFSINLLEDEAEIFKDLLWNYRDVFSKDEWDLGRTHLTEREIVTENSFKKRE